MTRTLAISNLKGGVGKTTSCLNIAGELALRGWRTLLVDLDAQQDLTKCLLAPGGPGIARDIYDALVRGERAVPVNVRERLDLIPASIRLIRADADMGTDPGKALALRRYLEAEATGYDFIVLDSSPSLGVTTYNALAAADYCIIPLTAEYLPYQGLTMLMDVIREIRQGDNPGLDIGGIFLTRYNYRTLNSVIAQQVREAYREHVLTAVVRENITLAEAALQGRTARECDPRCNGAKDYEAITAELLGKVNGGRLRAEGLDDMDDTSNHTIPWEKRQH